MDDYQKRIKIGTIEKKILNYLRYKINMKKEIDIRRKIFKEESIQSSLNSLKNKKLIEIKNISKFHGSNPIAHYAISAKGENFLKKIK